MKQLKNYLVGRLEAAGGLEVLKKIEESKYRPRKKLMEHVGYVIKGNYEYESSHIPRQRCKEIKRAISGTCQEHLHGAALKGNEGVLRLFHGQGY